MLELQRGVLKYYNDGKFFQRIEEAKTPEELESIYNELNTEWEKKVIPVSKDILDLFLYNKYISKTLFEKVISRLSFDALKIIEEIYINLEQYAYIELIDLLSIDVLGYPDNYEEFSNYILNQTCKLSVLTLIIMNNPGCVFREKLITLFWEARNQILDDKEKKLFVKKILIQENVSKDILLQAFEEFKNDIDIVVEVFVNGIEYPEIFSKVLEKFPKDLILKKIKSDILNSTEDEINLYIPSQLHKIMSVARIADDDTLKQILQITYYELDAKELFAPQDENEILGKPEKLLIIDETWNKILLSIARNPNASLETLKYIVQSTNDIETLYYCIVNSNRHLGIMDLIIKKEIPPVQEDLKHNEVLARFDEEMENMKEYIEEYVLVTQAVSCPTDLGNKEDFFEKRFSDTIRNFRLWDIDDTYHIYSIISGVLTPRDHCYKINNPGVFMDKIREQLKNLSFETISLGGYSPDNFVDLQSKEKAYFDCLVNYGLVNDNDVRNFLETCLGEKYLRRYERDIALFNERGLDLSQTSKGAQQRG